MELPFLPFPEHRGYQMFCVAMSCPPSCNGHTNVPLRNHPSLILLLGEGARLLHPAPHPHSPLPPAYSPLPWDGQPGWEHELGQAESAYSVPLTLGLSSGVGV